MAQTDDNGTLPDYYLGAIDKDTGEKNNRVGAAWKNIDGTLTLRFNAFVNPRILKRGVSLRMFVAENKPPKS